jgi:hypothetical protein
MDSFKSLRLEFCLPCAAITVLAVAIVSTSDKEEPSRSGGIVIGDWRNNMVLRGLASSAPGMEWRPQASIHPRQSLLKCRKEPLPPVLGPLVGLLLIGPEASPGNAPEISALSAPMNEALTPRPLPHDSITE